RQDYRASCNAENTSSCGNSRRGRLVPIRHPGAERREWSRRATEKLGTAPFARAPENAIDRARSKCSADGRQSVEAGAQPSREIVLCCCLFHFLVLLPSASKSWRWHPQREPTIARGPGPGHQDETVPPQIRHP